MAGFDWITPAAEFGGSLIGAAGNLFGANQATSSANKALKKALKARQAGINQATTTLSPDLDSSGADNLLKQRMVSNPAVLTPSQAIARGDLIRTTEQALAAGGNAGAGRSGAAVVADAARRFDADAFDQNQGRSDAAVNTLSQRGASTRAGLANIQSGAGSANAGDILDVGTSNGDTQGAATIANANLLGSTLGAIASQVNQKRVDKYGPASLYGVG